MKNIIKEIQTYDYDTSYKEYVEDLGACLQDYYNQNKDHYEVYPQDLLTKQAEYTGEIQELRTSRWQEFITLINIKTGLNISCHVSTHSDDHIKKVLINTIEYELMCLSEKSWLRYITFDRAVLVISTLGSIVVNIIQACNL